MRGWTNTTHKKDGRYIHLWNPIDIYGTKTSKSICYKKQDIIFNCFRMSLCKLQIRVGLFLIEKVKPTYL